MKLTVGFMALALSFSWVACKNKKSGSDRNRDVTAEEVHKGEVQDATGRDSIVYPSVPGDPKDPSAQPGAEPKIPAASGSSAAFPFVIEMPKEQYPRVDPIPGEDNSCLGLGKPVQTGNIYQIPLNVGGSVAPGTPVRAGFVTSTMTCQLWGRVKGIPAGYRVKATFPATTALKAKANLRATTDRGQFPLTFDFAGKDPANLKSDTQFYGGSITPRRGNNTPFSDVLNSTLSYSPADLILTEAPTGTQTCPTIAHDVLFSIFILDAGIRVSSEAAALPADGFTHSFFITQFPDIAFTVEKCN